MGVRPAIDQAGQLPVAIGRHLQASQRIVPVRVEAGRYEQQLRPEGVQGGTDFLLPRAEKGAVPSALRKGYVEDVAMGAALSGAPRSRIERVLVGRGVEDLGVMLEAVLGTVAVVDVEVEHRDAPDVLCARGHDADGDIVDQAEAHRLCLLGVMARWAHHREGVPDPTIQDSLDAGHHRAGGGASGGHGVRRDVGVRVEVAAARGCRAIEHRDVARIVDLLDQRISHRRRWLGGHAEVGYRDRLQNGGDPLRALWMAFGLVPALLRVGEQRNHSKLRARKRSTCSAAFGLMPAF